MTTPRNWLAAAPAVIIICGWLLFPAPAGAAETNTTLKIVVPAGVGGGLDGTARAVARVLAEGDNPIRVRVENRSGGGGSRAIAWLMESAASRTDTMLVTSTPVVVRSVQGLFPQSWRDLTPIAAMIADYGLFAVSPEAPWQSWEALLDALRANPRALRFGGGSVRGNLDHIVLGLALKAGGIDPARVVYVPYDGGARAVGGLLSGEVHAISSGVGESLPLVADGLLRALAVTAPAPLTSLPQVPTLRSLGYAVTFANWRGFFAPPQVSPAVARGHQQMLAALRQRPAWKQALVDNGWEDRFLVGPAFVADLQRQERDIQAIVQRAGLAR